MKRNKFPLLSYLRFGMGKAIESINWLIFLILTHKSLAVPNEAALKQRGKMHKVFAVDIQASDLKHISERVVFIFVKISDDLSILDTAITYINRLYIIVGGDSLVFTKFRRLCKRCTIDRDAKLFAF